MASPLDYIRESVPWMKGFSDEEILKKTSDITGMNVQDVAEHWGIPTGRNASAPVAGIKSGLHDLAGLGLSAGAAVLDATGWKGGRDYLNEAADNQQTASQLASRPDLENIEGVWESPSKWLPYAGYQVAKQVPQIAGAIGLGALVPEVAVPAALSRGAAFLPKVLGGGGMRAGIAAAENFAERRAAVEAAQAAGTTFGKQVLGGLAFNEGQSVGSLYQEAVDAGRPDASGEAFAKSIPYALSETLPEAMLAGRFIHGSGLSGNVARRMGISGLVQGTSGATSEALQNELEMSMHRGDLTPEQITSRRLNAPVAGGLVEGLLGGLGGFRRHASLNDRANPTNLVGNTEEETAPDPLALQKQINGLAGIGAGMTPQERAQYQKDIEALYNAPSGIYPGSGLTMPAGPNGRVEPPMSQGDVMAAQFGFAPPLNTPKPGKPSTAAPAATTTAAPAPDPNIALNAAINAAVRPAFVATLPADHGMSDGTISSHIRKAVGNATTRDEALANIEGKIKEAVTGKKRNRQATAERLIQFYDNILGTPEDQRLPYTDWEAKFKPATPAPVAANPTQTINPNPSSSVAPEPGVTVTPTEDPTITAAREVVSATDQGGIPLNPAKLRVVAEGLGLEVSANADPAETVGRIKEAVARHDASGTAAAPAAAAPAPAAAPAAPAAAPAAAPTPAPAPAPLNLTNLRNTVLDRIAEKYAPSKRARNRAVAEAVLDMDDEGMTATQVAEAVSEKVGAVSPARVRQIKQDALKAKAAAMAEMGIEPDSPQAAQLWAYTGEDVAEHATAEEQLAAMNEEGGENAFEEGLPNVGSAESELQAADAMDSDLTLREKSGSQAAGASEQSRLTDKKRAMLWDDKGVTKLADDDLMKLFDELNNAKPEERTRAEQGIQRIGIEMKRRVDAGLWAPTFHEEEHEDTEGTASTEGTQGVPPTRGQGRTVAQGGPTVQAAGTPQAAQAPEVKVKRKRKAVAPVDKIEVPQERAVRTWKAAQALAPDIGDFNLLDEGQKRAWIAADEKDQNLHDAVLLKGGERPDVTASKAKPTRNSTTREAVIGKLREWGLHPRGASSKVHVVQSWNKLPKALQDAAKQAGHDSSTTSGLSWGTEAWLIADNIEPGNERGVFFHEVGAHIGLTEEEQNHLANIVRGWKNAAEGSLERQVYDRTVARMTSAKEEASNNHEFIAYATEEAVNMGVKPEAVSAVGRFLKEVSARIMAKLRQIMGIYPKTVTAQDLVDYTYGAAQFVVREMGKPEVRAGVPSASVSAATVAAEGQKQVVNAKTVGQRTVLGAMITNDIGDWAKRIGFPEIKQYVEAQYKMAGARERNQAPVGKVLEMYDHLPERERGLHANSVNQFIQTATLNDSLAGINRFSAAGQALIKAVFKHGSDTLTKKKDMVLKMVGKEFNARIAQATDPADIAKLTRERDAMLRRFSKLMTIKNSDTYAHLARFGDYMVSGKSKEWVDAEKNNDTKWMAANEADPAHRWVEFFDTMGEAEAAKVGIESRYAGGQTYAAMRTADLNNSHDLFRAFPVLKRMLASASPMQNGPSPMERLIQDLYLSALAENSARQAEKRRKKTGGASVDMMRAFESQGRADAFWLANLEHNDEVQDAVQAMEDGAKRDPAKFNPFLHEMLQRHKLSYEAGANRTSDKLKRMTSLWMLATSPSFYLQQLVQPWTISLPVIAAKHGYFRTARALEKGYEAIADLVKNTNLTGHIDWTKAPADVRQMLDTLSHKGAIDITNAMEQGEWQTAGTNKATAAWNKIDAKLRGLNTRVESLNRAATAVAAYRMEMLKNGGNHDAATQYAEDMVRQTHGSYDGTNTPRYMKGPVASVLTQFRRFQIIQLSLVARLAHNSFAQDLTPEERAVARKGLLYIMAHTAALGGAMGMPAAEALTPIIAKLFGDPDEPDDFEQMMRKKIGDQAIADLLLKGLPAAAGVDVSAKWGLGQILSVAPFANLPTDRKSYEQYMLALAGPAVGLGAKAVDGMAQIYKGDVAKGMENLMPNGIANAMKGVRFAREGVTMRNGDVVIPPEDLSAIDLFMQGAGLPTMKITRARELQQTKYEYDTYYHDHESQLKNDYIKARKAGQDTSDIRQKWNDLQESRVRNGYARQPLSTLLRAPVQQAKRERNVEGGVEFSKQNRNFVRTNASI